VIQAIRNYRPGFIVNLIGHIQESNPQDLYLKNVLPLISIAEAVRELGLHARILTMGSAAELGEAGQTEPVSGNRSPNVPTSHYGASKAAQTMAALVYAHRYNIDVVIARPFNIVGRDMSPDLVPACFVRQILSGSSSSDIPVIHTKDLTPVRDFIAIEDVVDAILLILTKSKSGESYNICSGTGTSIRAILELVLREAGISAYRIDENKSATSSGGISSSIGDNSNLRALGWTQQVTLEQSIRRLVSGMRDQGLVETPE